MPIVNIKKGIRSMLFWLYHHKSPFTINIARVAWIERSEIRVTLFL